MLDAIRRRRSIRRFQDRPVDDDVLETLLRAAMQAPSARNLQPWEFVVVTDRSILKSVPDHHPHASMVPDAAAAILVCGNTDYQNEPGYIAQDCSAAVQNLLLEAVNQGLGAVWLGVFPRKERIESMTKLFGLPGEVIPLALVAIGYPAEEPDFQDRFNPDRIHHNRW